MRSTITYRRLQRFFHFSSEKYCMENSEKKNRASMDLESSFPLVFDLDPAQNRRAVHVVQKSKWGASQQAFSTHTREHKARLSLNACILHWCWNSRAESGRAAVTVLKPQSKRIEQRIDGGRARGRALERDQFSNARARRARPEAGGVRGGRARIGRTRRTLSCGFGAGSFQVFELVSVIVVHQSSRDISMDGRC